MNGGAADVAPLEDDHRAIHGLAHSRLFEEARQHLLLALREIRGRPVRTLLEHHHRSAPGGDLRRGDRASGSGADHTDVGLLAEILLELAQIDTHAGASSCHERPRYPIRAQVASWL